MLETRCAVVDPPTRPQRESGTALRKSPRRTAQAVSCYAVAKTRPRLSSLKRSEPSFGRGNVLSARPARKTSLFGRRPLEGQQRPKKPGPSLLQVASPVGRGSPVRLRLPVFQGRLTGLLSRSPPTDTRPQARAYWARSLFVRIAPGRKGFLVLRQTNSRDRDDCGGTAYCLTLALIVVLTKTVGARPQVERHTANAPITIASNKFRD